MDNINNSIKNVGFFRKIIYAVVNPKKYVVLTKTNDEKVGGFVYGFFLFIMIFAIGIPYFINLSKGITITNFIENELPQFHLSDGELYLNKKIEVNNVDTFFQIDTNIEKITDVDLDAYKERYKKVILISKTNMGYFSKGKTLFLKFKYLPINISDVILTQFIPSIKVIIVISILFLYLLLPIFYLLVGLIFGFFASILQNIVRVKLPFDCLFRICIYGMVPMTIVTVLLSVFKWYPPYLLYIYIIATLIYIMMGIMAHKNDPVNSKFICQPVYPGQQWQAGYPIQPVNGYQPGHPGYPPQSLRNYPNTQMPPQAPPIIYYGQPQQTSQLPRN